MDEFRAGVTASLRSWSALRTAVESGWGGANSAQKAEDLRSYLFEHFNGESVPPKSMADVTDLEDALAIFIEEEFSVVVEDKSEQQIARVIWTMYEDCVKLGNVGTAINVVNVAEKAANSLHQDIFPIQIVAPENADDSDDENGNEDYDDAAEPAMDTTVGETHFQDAIPKETTLTLDSKNATPSTVDTATVVLHLATTSAAEYAAQPLFAASKKRKSRDQPPSRQLGESSIPIPKHDEPIVDDDGFAPVTKQKRRSRQDS